MSIVTRHTYTEVIGTDENRVKNEVTQYHFLGIPLFTTRKEIWRKGSEIDPHIRRIIRLMDNDECVYCGAKYTEKSRFAIDHIIPQVQGGSTYIFNLALACMQCNGSKNGRTPNEAGMGLAYGRFFTSDKGEGMAIGWKRDGMCTIPMGYEVYCQVMPTINWIGPERLHTKNGTWPDWCELVKNFNYGEPFNTEFIACKGKIPFLY